MPCVKSVDQFLVCCSSVETALNFSWEDKEDFHLRSAKPSSTVKRVLRPDLSQRRFSPRVEPRKLSYSVYSASALQQGKFLVTLASKQSRVWFHFQIKESNLNSLKQLSLMFHKFHSDKPEYSFFKFYTLKEYQGKLYIRSVIIANYRRGYWCTLLLWTARVSVFLLQGYFWILLWRSKSVLNKMWFYHIKFWVKNLIIFVKWYI